MALYRRAFPPETTVRRLSELLTQAGIAVREYVWPNGLSHIHCINLQSVSYPPLVSSGKGVTEALARASAYAEFVERLQSGVLLPPAFGCMSGGPPAPDARQLPFEALPAVFVERGIARGVAARLHGRSFECVPFVELGSGALAYLPARYIDLSSGSNGIASGNTDHEALCHAAFEVMERHVIARVFDEPHLLPRVDLATVPASVQAMISEVRTSGYEVIVKDATFGGRFPVMAVLAVHERGVRYAFGSDVSLEICLQRCLTELFQEEDANGLERPHCPVERLMDDDDSPSRAQRLAARRLFARRERASVPHQLLLDGAQPAHEAAFSELPAESTWPHVRALLLERFGTVYARNLSTLGFPTWRLYVPGISDIHAEGRTLGMSVTADLDVLRAGLARLPSRSEAELRELVMTLESHLDRSDVMLDRAGAFSDFTGIRHGPDPFLDGLSLFALLGHLCLGIGDLSRAREYFHRAIGPHGAITSPADRRTIKCILLLLRAREAGQSDAESEASLRRYFDWMTARKVFNVYGRAEPLRHMRLPDCGDCSKCPARAVCHYEGYERLLAGIAWKTPPTLEIR